MQTVIGDCQSLQWDAAVRGPRRVSEAIRLIEKWPTRGQWVKWRFFAS